MTNITRRLEAIEKRIEPTIPRFRLLCFETREEADAFFKAEQERGDVVPEVSKVIIGVAWEDI